MTIHELRRASQVVWWVKNLPAMWEMQEMQVGSLGGEDPPEEGMATHSSILAFSMIQRMFYLAQNDHFHWVKNFIWNSCIMYVCSVTSSSLRLYRPQPPRLLCPWESPGKNTGVGCHAFLRGIFPTQGSNPGLPHCRWILYCLSHQRSPRILEWVA